MPLVRARQGRNTFQVAISFRAWLPTATNACLDAIGCKRGRGGEESLGVGPYPTTRSASIQRDRGGALRYPLESISPPSSSPSSSLAAATPARGPHPADALSWRAAEAAAFADPHRAGGDQRVGSSTHDRPREYAARPRGRPPSVDCRAGQTRSLLDRYVRAWEATDIAALSRCCGDDAVVSMPPGVTVTGRRRSVHSYSDPCSSAEHGSD